MFYFDNNATTRLAPEVLAAMQPYFTALAGNPSSRHAMGRQARRGIDQAKRQIAEALDCDLGEIFFTSGATEANNLAVFASAGRPGSHVLVNPAEHPSALEPAQSLRQRSYTVEELSLDAEGRITDWTGLLRGDTSLVIVQRANSETGCLQDVSELARSLPPRCRFHCDAVQAVGRIAVQFRTMGVTTLALSGHKLHGPPGIGALLVRADCALAPVFFGGHQQSGLRPGTEPVALMVGLGAAVELAVRELAATQAHLVRIRDRFEALVLQRIETVERNGPLETRLPNTSNLSFRGAKAEALLIALDLAGVCCSAGTACASGSLEPSPVLQAMGLHGDRLNSAVRFSFSRETSEAEIDAALPLLERAVRQVRAASALHA